MKLIKEEMIRLEEVFYVDIKVATTIGTEKKGAFEKSVLYIDELHVLKNSYKIYCVHKNRSERYRIAQIHGFPDSANLMHPCFY